MFTNKEWLLNILAGNIEIIESKGIELKEGFLNVDPMIYDIFKVEELSNGSIIVDLRCSGVLGDESQIFKTDV